MKSPVKLIRRARSIPISWGSRIVRPAARHDPDPGVGVGEARPLGGDQEVAAQGQLEAAGDRRAR